MPDSGLKSKDEDIEEEFVPKSESAPENIGQDDETEEDECKNVEGEVSQREQDD